VTNKQTKAAKMIVGCTWCCPENARDRQVRCTTGLENDF